MSKLSYSFFIAFAVHLIIFGLSSFFIDTKISPALLDTKNMIDVQLGAGSTKTKGNSLKVKNSSRTVHELNVTTSATSPSEPQGTGDTGQGSGVKEGNGFTFEDSAVSYAEPIYPKLAIKKGMQGNVFLRIKVSPEGVAEGVEILKSSGHETLDKAALEAISSWRFQKRNNAYFVEKNVLFQLRG